MSSYRVNQRKKTNAAAMTHRASPVIFVNIDYNFVCFFVVILTDSVIYSHIFRWSLVVSSRLRSIFDLRFALSLHATKCKANKFITHNKKFDEKKNSIQLTQKMIIYFVQ